MMRNMYQTEEKIKTAQISQHALEICEILVKERDSQINDSNTFLVLSFELYNYIEFLGDN